MLIFNRVFKDLMRENGHWHEIRKQNCSEKTSNYDFLKNDSSSFGGWVWKSLCRSLIL